MAFIKDSSSLCYNFTAGENSLHGIFFIIHTSAATGSTGPCSPRGRHACAEPGPAVEVCSLLGPLGAGSLLCQIQDIGHVFTGFGASPEESSQVLFP